MVGVKQELRGYLPISIDTVTPVESLNFDLYLCPGNGESMVLYRERSYPINQEDMQRLVATGIRTLYIRVESHEDYRQFLYEEVIANPALPLTQRYKVLSQAARSAFESAMRLGDTDRLVDFSADFGARMSEVIATDTSVARDLLPLMAHDYYTYTHLANVCTYSLLLAHSLGIKNREDLMAIGAGAMLHDLGKRHISPTILNFRGRLDQEQWSIMRTHPTLGFRDLAGRSDLSWGQLMMVYQHHERPDGQGYPVGIRGSEIHDWARICKVADVFDALSCDRPYRKANSVQWVLDYLVDRAEPEFDKDMVKCFHLMLSCRN